MQCDENSIRPIILFNRTRPPSVPIHNPLLRVDESDRAYPVVIALCHTVPHILLFAYSAIVLALICFKCDWSYEMSVILSFLASQLALALLV
jgi:hypothetical protein